MIPFDIGVNGDGQHGSTGICLGLDIQWAT